MQLHATNNFSKLKVLQILMVYILTKTKLRSRPVKMVLIEFFICCHRVYVPINFFAQTLNCLNYLCRSALQCLSHSNNWDNLANFDTFLVFVAHQNINKCLCPGTGTTLDGREAGAAEAISRINHGNGKKDLISIS